MLHGELIRSLDRHIAESRIRHLYLFTGEEGIGKRTVALDMANKLLCSAEVSRRPCGVCIGCRTFKARTNVDFIFIEPGGEESKSGNILIEQSRRIIDEASLKPVNSDRKAFVIADAHKLTEQAMNALLKTLEEPPGYLVIILTCTSKELLLDTIVSRAFHFSLKAQPDEAIVKILGNVSPVALGYGNGNIGRVKECMKSGFEETRQKALCLVENIIGRKFGDIEENDFIDDLEDMIYLVLNILRDVLIIKGRSDLIVNADVMDRLERIAGMVDFKRLDAIIERARRSYELLRIFTNKRSVFSNFVYGSQEKTIDRYNWSKI